MENDVRQTINILWLEDDITSDAHSNRKYLVDDILQEKGYEANISEYETFSEANKELLSIKRYDFFISDFNLEGEETGLTYLKKIRERNGFKQFVILYSNNAYNTIKTDVLNAIKDENLDVFSNFTFFSVADNSEETRFQNAIDVILCRWDELNAIRGRYMCENAEIEHLLREKLGDNNQKTSYRTLFNNFFRERVRMSRPNLSQQNKREYQDLYDEWSLLIDKRNSLAHVEEGFDKQEGYYISSLKDKSIKIKENNLDEERRKLVELKERIVKFLNKSYY